METISPIILKARLMRYETQKRAPTPKQIMIYLNFLAEYILATEGEAAAAPFFSLVKFQFENKERSKVSGDFKKIKIEFF